MSRSYKMYNTEGYYFVSFATVGWIDVFTRVIYKDILIDSLRFCQYHKKLSIHAYCIMTNHVHLIISKTGAVILPDILRDFKRHTSKEVIKAIQDNNQESRKEWMLSIFGRAGQYNPNNTNFQFWQQNNKPIEVYTNAVMDQKIDYIHQNPIVAGYVDREEDYLYSSARDYSGTKGLLDIALLI
jgi:putative transposase